MTRDKYFVYAAGQMAHRSWPPSDLDARAAPELGALRVRVTWDDDRVLVCPVGDVDLATAGSLESQIDGLLENGFDRVVIDLRAVTFLDSTGIHALLNAHRRARESNGAISIILGGRATRRPLELTGATNYLDVEPPSAATPKTAEAFVIRASRLGGRRPRAEFRTTHGRRRPAHG